MANRTSSPLLLASLAGLLFIGVGCITVGTGSAGAGAADGAVFKSVNKGDSWVQKAAVPTTTGQKASIGGVSVATIVQDPEDPNALYLGTNENGMFYSYDAGESWRQPSQVSGGRIASIAIHPRNKCVIYATAENKLLKSEDCSRTWSVPFLDSRTDKRTKAVAVDSYNPNVIWLGLNTGDLLKSSDNGNSWANVKNFNNDEIMKIMISPADTRRVYVAMKASGVWRSDDAGASWIDLSEKYKDFGGAREFGDLAIGVSDPRVLVLASRYGLIRSSDGGDTWEKIDLLTPPGSTLIYSVAVDPKDPNNLYYGTSTTFYRSANAGLNWVPKKLPTSRTSTALMVDAINSSVLYMGVTKFGK